MSAKTHERHPVKPEIHRLANDVVIYARQRGWKVVAHHSPHGGFPQLVMVRSTIAGDHRLIFARLMGSTDYLKPAQAEWMRDIESVAEFCRPHLSAYAWRPDDWPAIEEILQ